MLGGPGDVLYFARDANASRHAVPFQNRDGDLARALAYVVRNASGGFDVPALHLANLTTLDVHEVPQRDASGNVSVRNLTLDLALLAGDAGFVVKRDDAPAPEATLVPLERVHGKVLRVVPASALWQALGLAAFGFLLPLGLIIASHRGRGARGVGGGPVCPECGRPTQGGVAFCVRCGALLPKR